MSFRHHSNAKHAQKSATADDPTLRQLVEARDALERARGKATWIRKSRDLHRATRAVEDAALAAHRAGVSWNEIGSLLGIERAIVPSVAPISLVRNPIGAKAISDPGDLPEFGAAVAI